MPILGLRPRPATVPCLAGPAQPAGARRQIQPRV